MIESETKDIHDIRTIPYNSISRPREKETNNPHSKRKNTSKINQRERICPASNPFRWTISQSLPYDWSCCDSLSFLEYESKSCARSSRATLAASMRAKGTPLFTGSNVVAIDVQCAVVVTPFIVVTSVPPVHPVMSGTQQHCGPPVRSTSGNK